MAVVLDPKTGRSRVIECCRSCAADIYWSISDAGKPCPFDIGPNHEPTRVSHFKSCPQASQWSRRKVSTEA